MWPNANYLASGQPSRGVRGVPPIVVRNRLMEAVELWINEWCNYKTRSRDLVHAISYKDIEGVGESVKLCYIVMSGVA